jgi:hypothetical protein
MELSENIPGSFESPSHDVYIRYKLVVYLVNFNDPSIHHRYESPLLIREPFRQLVSEYEGNITTNPKKMLFFAQGEVTLDAHFMSNCRGM